MVLLYCSFQRKLDASYLSGMLKPILKLHFFVPSCICTMLFAFYLKPTLWIPGDILCFLRWFSTYNKSTDSYIGLLGIIVVLVSLDTFHKLSLLAVHVNLILFPSRLSAFFCYYYYYSRTVSSFRGQNITKRRGSIPPMSSAPGVRQQSDRGSG